MAEEKSSIFHFDSIILLSTSLLYVSIAGRKCVAARRKELQVLKESNPFALDPTAKNCHVICSYKLYFATGDTLSYIFDGTTTYWREDIDLNMCKSLALLKRVEK